MLTYWYIPVVFSCSLFWMLLLLLRLCVFNAQLNAGHYCVPSPQSKCGKCDCLHSNVIQMFSILRTYVMYEQSVESRSGFRSCCLSLTRPEKVLHTTQTVSVWVRVSVSELSAVIAVSYQHSLVLMRREIDQKMTRHVAPGTVLSLLSDQTSSCLTCHVHTTGFLALICGCWLFFKVRQQKATDQRQADTRSSERWLPMESRRLLDI